eukprot:TRINITY_DN123099_c0_g1_i1.p1 TRINITY_DN123099_c0_g1~~TRINITY_DN123099_c0_g1_i1.p1  ORF type:complete len:153 (-),score=8.17 TRINITY_DN123099_c0_g1_i1:171-629(-)
MDRGSHSYSTERILPGTSPAEAFQLFFDTVWIGGGGLGRAATVNAGDGTTREGHIRAVVGGLLHEEIVLSKPGSVLEYRIKSGPAAVSYYRGQLKFCQQGAEGTRVSWLVSYTPISPAWLFGPLVTMSVRFLFAVMLWTLARRAAAAKRERK